MYDTKQKLQELATKLGFDLIGVTSAERFGRGDVAQERVRRGLMDGLSWFTEDRVWRASRPGELLPGAKSVIAVGISYNGIQDKTSGGLRGKVARYAWGFDYHKIMKRRLKTLVEGLQEICEIPFRARIFVDDGPLLERAAAERSGIGWFGKNTMILTGSHGSWVFLGQVITDLELQPDLPLKKTCGACRICVDACPTGAIVAPYVLDNRKCIAFWTIEHRGSIPLGIRPLIGDWVFGCDICQDVCPVNRGVALGREPLFYSRNAGMSSLDLIDLLHISEEEFHSRFKASPIKRAKRVGLQRNACVALGNLGDRDAVPALARALINGDVLVRAHAAWALGRIGGCGARNALATALANESDTSVSSEISEALQALDLAHAEVVVK